MKITNWARTCSFVSIMAVGVACGTTQPVAEEKEGKAEVKPMPAELKENLNDVIVKVTLDAEGNPVSSEVRTLHGKDVTIADEAAAKLAFENAATATDETSADSFYNPGCGQYGSSYVNYSASYSNGCGDSYNTNYTSYNNQWPQYNYQPAQNYSSSTYYSSTTSSSNYGGYPVQYPVYGCQTNSCYNGAYGYWPSYYQNGYATPVRNFLFGRNNYYPTPVRNLLFGYRYPMARAYAGANCRYYQYPAW